MQVAGRKDEALARYARWEYGDDGLWLLAETRRRVPSLVARIRSWIRRLGRAPTTTASRGPTAADGGEAPAPPSSPRACSHGGWKPLGLGGTAAFYACSACGAVRVAQGGKVWSVGPTRPEVCP